MSFLEAAGLGVVGSMLYQLILANDFRERNKFWPWQNAELGMTIPAFIFGAAVKILAAFVVVGLLASTDQISGPWAALVAGMVADEIARKASARKDYGNGK